jgi:hypothetical protein
VEKPSHNRIQEAVDLGDIDYFVVACPKDAAMFTDAVKSSGNEDKFAVKEICELMAEALFPEPVLVGAGVEEAEAEADAEATVVEDSIAPAPEPADVATDATAPEPEALTGPEADELEAPEAEPEAAGEPDAAPQDDDAHDDAGQ